MSPEQLELEDKWRDKKDEQIKKEQEKKEKAKLP